MTRGQKQSGLLMVSFKYGNTITGMDSDVMLVHLPSRDAIIKTSVISVDR